MLVCSKCFGCSVILDDPTFRMDRFRLSVLDVSVVSTNFEPVTIEPAPFFGGGGAFFYITAAKVS